MLNIYFYFFSTLTVFTNIRIIFFEIILQSLDALRTIG